MIIRKMSASFGKLENRSLELHEGLNVIYAPNESGKTTWCAFIRAMLYGIDTSQREKGGVKPDKTLYAPWSGAAMEGEMEIEEDGRLITLNRRSKTASAPMKDFSARYTGTAQKVEGLTGTSAGVALTGMSKAVFESSVFVRQSGLSVSSSPELEKRIGAIVSTGEDSGESYTTADAQLRNWLRKRRHNRSGAIPALEAEIAEKQSALRSMDESVSERDSLARRLKAALAQEERAALSSRQQGDEQRKDLLAQREELRRRCQEAQQLKAQAMDKAMKASVETEKGPFGGMSASEALFQAGKDADMLTQLRSAVTKPTLIIILGILSALAFIAAAVFTLPILYGAAGIILAAGVILAALRNGKKKEASTYAFAIVQRYNATDGDGIMALADKHARACAAAEQAEQELRLASERASALQKELEDAEDKLMSSGAAARESAELLSARRESDYLRRQLALAEGRLEAMGDPMVTESELSALRDRHSQLQAQYEALALAISTLREANDEMQQRFSPRLSARAGELMSALTGGKYDRLVFDRELNALARRSGDTGDHELAFLSAGTADQLYLALRLAICELALPEGYSCPMILDDALVNFDEDRMGRALELLQELAKERQIILFTCHRREEEYLRSRK